MRRRPTLQAERMLIEIADGMRLLTVPAGTARSVDPFSVLVAAIRHPGEAQPARSGRLRDPSACVDTARAGGSGAPSGEQLRSRESCACILNADVAPRS